MYIALLQSVSKYFPRMGHPASPLDYCTLASREKLSYRTTAYTNWPPTSFQKIGSTVHIPTDLAIDAMLVVDLYTEHLRTFSSTDANLDTLLFRKTIYAPAPFSGIFLKQDLTRVEAWTRIHSAIDGGCLEVYCHPITNWLRVALTWKTGNEKSPLTKLQPTAPMADGDLLWHRRNMLTRHLPSM